jgi:tryptophan 2,3-dioxygenase
MTATPAGMTYADYLQLDTLLSAQKPLSDLHDEMLFIVIHQAKELWMKQMLHELKLAISLLSEDRFAQAYKAMARISRIQSVMTLSWDVLATLTPVDYLKFRDVLGTSSGFQSAQFREIEFRLGLKEPNFVNHYAQGSDERARLEQALLEPSLREAGHGALERAGFDLKDHSLPALSAAWLKVYRDADRWFDLYELAEKLVDIDDALAAWRHKHVLTVERIIGNKPGTGGSAGAPYLRRTLEKRVFPELWSLRTEL